MARFFHSLWSRWGFLFIVSSFGMSGPLRGWPCLAPTGLPVEDQWGFFASTLLAYSESSIRAKWISLNLYNRIPPTSSSFYAQTAFSEVLTRSGCVIILTFQYVRSD